MQCRLQGRGMRGIAVGNFLWFFFRVEVLNLKSRGTVRSGLEKMELTHNFFPLFYK